MKSKIHIVSAIFAVAISLLMLVPLPAIAKDKQIARIGDRIYTDTELINKKVRRKHRLNTAVYKLRTIAIADLVALQMPDCDLSVTDIEREAYMNWWRPGLEDIAQKLTQFPRYGGIEQIREGMRIETVSLDNPKAVTHIDTEIRKAKRYDCIQEQEQSDTYFIIPDPWGAGPGPKEGTIVVSFQTRNGFVFPSHKEIPEPIASVSALLKRNEADGVLEFYNDEWRTIFWKRYDNPKLRNTPTAEVDRTPYWLERPEIVAINNLPLTRDDAEIKLASQVKRPLERPEILLTPDDQWDLFEVNLDGSEAVGAANIQFTQIRYIPEQ